MNVEVSSNSENECDLNSDSDTDSDFPPDVKHQKIEYEEKITQEEERITQGDYVKVISGMFHGYYAVVQGDGYGDEIELQYFKEKSGKNGNNYWVLADNDFDSREPSELIKVQPFEIDRRNQFYFE